VLVFLVSRLGLGEAQPEIHAVSRHNAKTFSFHVGIRNGLE
jgi:hypothetical protein